MGSRDTGEGGRDVGQRRRPSRGARGVDAETEVEADADVDADAETEADVDAAPKAHADRVPGAAPRAIVEVTPGAAPGLAERRRRWSARARASGAGWQGLQGLLAGYAGVVFSDRLGVGAWIALGTWIRPASGLAGLIASVSAHVAARALGYRVDAIRGGLYGTCALLVGLAAASGHRFDGRLAALVALAGVATALVTAVVGDLLHRGAGLPALALPFVLVASALAPAWAALPLATGGALHGPLVELTLPLPALADELLRGFGAIVFAPGQAAGLAVLAALLCSSRIATALGAVGILAALALAALIEPGAGGSGSSALAAGATPALAGARLAMTYNGALAAMALGAVWFVPGPVALAVAVVASLLTAWLTVGLMAALGGLGLAVLAWPFVLVTLVALRALHLRAPDRAPFPAPLPGQPPEANLEFATARAARFGIPGPPQLALPCAGTWAITQGVDGAHTHQGPWAHALDFEVLDEQGFPFRDHGQRVEDYFCFGLPVLAPVTGTVAAVFDGGRDCAPGDPDVQRPWGNAVVIAVAADLFCVVAHLRCGSVQVVPGQLVVVGQPIAACGASGRSPRPHLHLQVQRSAELGAPAIPFALVHYVVEDAARRYVPVGVPLEGERIATPAPSALVEAFAALPPGRELALHVDGVGAVRWRSELTLLGERCLLDLDRGDRLYFTVVQGSLTFTTHVGAGRGETPLRALFCALPRLPSVAGAMHFEDRPPAAALLGPIGRALHDVVSVLGDPLRTRARSAVRQDAGVLRVETVIGWGWFGRVRDRRRARVELDADGLREVELHGPGGAVFVARRAA